jgi:hypothetical protein
MRDVQIIAGLPWILHERDEHSAKTEQSRVRPAAIAHFLDLE